MKERANICHLCRAMESFGVTWGVSTLPATVLDYRLSATKTFRPSFPAYGQLRRPPCGPSPAHGASERHEAASIAPFYLPPAG